MDHPTSCAPLSAALLTVGGIGAAFAAASCCGLPFLLASTGIGFAWLTGLAIFSAPYRPFLLVGAAVCLVGGAALLWRHIGARGPAASGGQQRETRSSPAWLSVPCSSTWDMPMPDVICGVHAPLPRALQ